MANGGQVERFVVLSACGERQAIAQSRCLGLTGTDIHNHIHTYIQTGDDDASRLLASPFGLAIMRFRVLNTYCPRQYPKQNHSQELKGLHFVVWLTRYFPIPVIEIH